MRFWRDKRNQPWLSAIFIYIAGNLTVYTKLIRFVELRLTFKVNLLHVYFFFQLWNHYQHWVPEREISCQFINVLKPSTGVMGIRISVVPRCGHNHRKLFLCWHSEKWLYQWLENAIKTSWFIAIPHRCTVYTLIVYLNNWLNLVIDLQVFSRLVGHPNHICIFFYSSNLCIQKIKLL